MKKLFVLVFAAVLLISFAYSLPVPPPVPESASSSVNNYSNDGSSQNFVTSPSGSSSSPASNFSYGSKTFSDKQGFLGDMGTMFLVGGSFSWYKFSGVLLLFVVLVVAIVYLTLKRKKYLATKSVLVNNNEKNK